MKPTVLLNRRRTLVLLGAAGAGAILGPSKNEIAKAADATCIPVAAPQTEGPYWVEENLNRADIRVDPADGSVRPGMLLNLAIKVHEITSASCTALAGAHVDIWHCDAGGLYSDVAANSTVGRKFLRGYQTTDDDGVVNFITIYPGWYSGRTVHIHIRIRTYNGAAVYDAFTAQIFFDDTITDQVFAEAPYNTRRSRDTRNANDMVLTGTNGTVVYAALTRTAAGYSAVADVGVNLKQIAAAPAIKTGGVGNAASGAAGLVPGSWVSIYGTNLAASTHQLEGADLVGAAAIPTSLKGVSVTINNKPAYVGYVSPGQLNVQPAADTGSGTVNVTVMNASGTSTVTANMVAMQPGFWQNGNYVFAVRPDGSVVTAAKSGEIILLFGTGFGPTNPAVAPGANPPSGGAPLANSLVLTIGGVAATVQFSGLASAGVYQFNVVVPAIADGDHEIVARIAGLQSQSGLLLKTASLAASLGSFTSRIMAKADPGMALRSRMKVGARG